MPKDQSASAVVIRGVAVPIGYQKRAFKQLLVQKYYSMPRGFEALDISQCGKVSVSDFITACVSVCGLLENADAAKHLFHLFKGKKTSKIHLTPDDFDVDPVEWDKYQAEKLKESYASYKKKVRDAKKNTQTGIRITNPKVLPDQVGYMLFPGGVHLQKWRIRPNILKDLVSKNMALSEEISVKNSLLDSVVSRCEELRAELDSMKVSKADTEGKSKEMERYLEQAMSELKYREMAEQNRLEGEKLRVEKKDLVKRQMSQTGAEADKTEKAKEALLKQIVSCCERNTMLLGAHKDFMSALYRRLDPSLGSSAKKGSSAETYLNDQIQASTLAMREAEQTVEGTKKVYTDETVLEGGDKALFYAEKNGGSPLLEDESEDDDETGYGKLPEAITTLKEELNQSYGSLSNPKASVAMDNVKSSNKKITVAIKTKGSNPPRKDFKNLSEVSKSDILAKLEHLKSFTGANKGGGPAKDTSDAQSDASSSLISSEFVDSKGRDSTKSSLKANSTRQKNLKAESGSQLQNQNNQKTQQGTSSSKDSDSIHTDSYSSNSISDSNFKRLKAAHPVSFLEFTVNPTDGIRDLGFTGTIQLDRSIQVSSVDEGGWAQRNELKKGDLLFQINGMFCADMRSEQVYKALANRPVELVFASEEKGG